MSDKQDAVANLGTTKKDAVVDLTIGAKATTK
jgi:hypothetical protein